MAEPMAPEDILRACAYLEAVWREDSEAAAALLEHEPGEAGTAVLLIDLVENIAQWHVSSRWGLHDDMPSQEFSDAVEEISVDPAVQVSHVLINTLKSLTSTPTSVNSEIIARAILGFIVAIGGMNDSDDVMLLIDKLRQPALLRLELDSPPE